MSDHCKRLGCNSMNSSLVKEVSYFSPNEDNEATFFILIIIVLLFLLWPRVCRQNMIYFNQRC